MKKRVAIIGCSNDIKLHFAELRRSDEFDIVGVYSKDLCEYATKVDVYTSLSELLQNAKPEAIIIANSLSYNDIFAKCVQSCKFVFAHMPLAKNISNIREMKYHSNLSNALCAVGFLQRFNPVIVSLKKNLIKEEKIYSVNVICKVEDEAKFELQTLHNVDLIRYLCASNVASFSKLESKDDDKKQIFNLLCQIKMKNQILVSMHISNRYPVDRFVVEVVGASGIYYADLLGLKLNKYTNQGQQNLKVYADISALKLAYTAFYELCESRNFGELAELDDALNAYGAFV